MLSETPKIPDEEILLFLKENFLHSFINLNRRDLEISWDLDQTLAITEDPVKNAVDKDFGTKYSERKIQGWNSISRWLLKDGKFSDPGKAEAYEHRLWIDNDILFKALPNDCLRALSYVAWQRGIPQSISTVRVPGLRQSTYKWIDRYFWWINPGDVNFNIGSADKSFSNKVDSILDLYAKNPGLIHVDDDVFVLSALAEKANNLGIIGINHPGQKRPGIDNSANRYFIERDRLGSLIYYKPEIKRLVAHS